MCLTVSRGNREKKNENETKRNLGGNEGKTDIIQLPFLYILFSFFSTNKGSTVYLHNMLGMFV